jgi:hypothetical protein
MLKICTFVIRDLVAAASLSALAFRGTAIPGCALGFSFFCSGRFPKRVLCAPDGFAGRVPFACGTVTPACALGLPGNADLPIGSYSVFVAAQHPPQAGAPSRHNHNHSSFRAKRGISLLLGFSVAGCPTRRFCVWGLGLPSLVLSSRPEQRRLMPLRSGGIVARPKCSPNPVFLIGACEVWNPSFSRLATYTLSGSSISCN